jgi:membrane-associated phospholipid phosphatase
VKHPVMTTIDRFGERFQHHRPAVVATLLVLLAFVITAATLIALGLFITNGPLSGPIGRWDADVSRWFVARRTSTLDTATVFGSGLGMTEVIVGLELLAVVVLALVHRWRDVSFLVLAVTLEASVAFTSSTVVDRPRPQVARLDVVPPTKSFPSGHTAAAIALYIGVAMLVDPHVRNRVTRVLLWAVALIIPVVVGVSRVYRGMHHPTDTLGSVLLGAMALWIAWLVVACTASVWRRRQERPEGAIEAESTGSMVQVGR